MGAIFLELFGHILITLVAALGYLTYFKNPKISYLSIYCAGWSDVGGFVSGKMWGKDKWVKNISPSKTKQGVIGAIILPTCILMIFYVLGQLSNGYLAIKMPAIDYILIGLICGSLSILGDLIESFIKRCSNVKDSANLVPEHGGVMDRIDSLALVTPFLFIYANQLALIQDKTDYSPDSIHFLQLFTY